MKKLTIYDYQARRIEDTFRLINNLLKCQSKETCLDRDVMQSWEFIKNVLDEKPDKQVVR